MMGDTSQGLRLGCYLFARNCLSYHSLLLASFSILPLTASNNNSNWYPSRPRLALTRTQPTSCARGARHTCQLALARAPSLRPVQGVHLRLPHQGRALMEALSKSGKLSRLLSPIRRFEPRCRRHAHKRQPAGSRASPLGLAWASHKSESDGAGGRYTTWPPPNATRCLR